LKKLLSATLISSLLLPALASAADPASAVSELDRSLQVLEREQTVEELRRESRRVDREEEQKAAEAAGKTPEGPEMTFLLQKVEFTASKALAAAELDAVAQKYEQKQISIQGLYDIVNEVNALYRERGYLTAMALLPQQEIKGGVVKIILLEGVVGDVELSGARSTKASYILKRVRIPKGVILDFKELDKELQWFNGSNDVKLHIDLRAGREPGTTDFFLTVQEPKKVSGIVFADNAGSESTGETRFGLGFTDSSLTGARDTVSAALLFSSDSYTGMVNYTVPVTRRGGKVTAYYNRSKLKINQADLNNFNIRGNSSAYGLTYTHPLLIRSRLREELIFDVQSQSSRTSILGVDFADNKEKRLSLGLAVTRYKPGEVVYFKPAFVYGNYDDRIWQESRKARKFTLDFFWQRQTRRNVLYSASLSGQWAFTDFLPASDQFYLGGLYSVRGYEENVISADSGLSLNLEVRLPLKSPKLRVILFSDFGLISGPNALSTKTLFSLGGGLQYEFARNGSATLTAGVPLQKTVNDVKADAVRLHFSLNYRF
jgi:hemolysin activation/secretion protein